jgi:DMSO/TMAO reductase YedYZ heme-binding membrane subunit
MDNKMNYFKKMKGSTKSPPAVSLLEIFWSWIGAVAGIAPVAYINYNLLDGTDFVMVILTAQISSWLSALSVLLLSLYTAPLKVRWLSHET